MESFEFSVLIPTWNNRALLQNCIESIRKHSEHRIQVLVFVNEGRDDTLEWLEENEVQYLHDEVNVGICTAMNRLRALVRSDLICYLNDDMYVLPGWDTSILKRIREFEDDYFFASSTMIEPIETGNRCSITKDYGQSLTQFEEDRLLEEFENLEHCDWSGSSWPPLFLSVKLWDAIGGFSEEFSPGMYSDPDMARKSWEIGNRIFVGVGSSRVYHFGSKSTKRVKKNKGRKTFILKWQMSSRFFYQHYLKMGEEYTGSLVDKKVRLIDKLINKTKYWKERLY